MLFQERRGYPFRVFSLSPSAATFLDRHFDFHVQKQEESHLQNQEQAKYHGKAKTKHLRLAFALHLFEQCRLQAAPEVWNLVVEERHLRAAESLGKYLDSVSAKLDSLSRSTTASNTMVLVHACLLVSVWARSSRRTGPSFCQLAAPQSFWISSGDWMPSGSRAPPLPVSESARSCSAPSIGGTGPRSPDFGGFNLSYFFAETLCLKPPQNETPEGPSTQIVGFQGPKPFRVWILAPKTLLFGYLDPLGTI